MPAGLPAGILALLRDAGEPGMPPWRIHLGTTATLGATCTRDHVRQALADLEMSGAVERVHPRVWREVGSYRVLHADPRAMTRPNLITR